MSAIEAALCDDCKGTGWVYVTFGDGRRVQRCRCLQERIDRKAQLRAGEGPWPIPEILRFESLQSFELTGLTPSVREAFHGAERFAEHPSGGILLTGPAGTGKSHLAAAILRQVNREAHFVEVPALMARLRSTFNAAGESAEQMIDELARVPMLVLDDLGAERTTKFSEESIYMIVHKRYASRKPLIVTTNKGVIEGKDTELLVDFVGERTFDRVMGMCWRHSDGRLNVFNMHGASKRWGK